MRIAFLLILLCTTAPQAQTAPTTQPDNVRVYLVTLGPGAEVWEKFGHNMLWVHDPASRAGDVDVAYNWGMFNFDGFMNCTGKNASCHWLIF